MPNIDAGALEAAAQHSYEWEGDRRGISYAGWSLEPDAVKDEWRNSVREAVSAYATEAFVLVPRECSERMIIDGRQALLDWDARSGDDMGMTLIWRAMLAAATEE